MRLHFSILALCLLPGCTHYVPIVVRALPCMPAQEVLESCTAPVAINEGLTYSDLLADYQTDRQRLRLCAVHHEALKKAVDTCNDEIGRLNKTLSRMSAVEPH